MPPPLGSKIGCFNVIPHPDSANNPDSYLLCKETAAHKLDLLNLLGGGFESDTDEVIVNAASREGQEEGGGELIVKAIGGIGLIEYPNPDQHRLHVVFASVVVEGEPAPSEEHPEVDYFSFRRVRAMDKAGKLRGPAVLKSIDLHRRGMIIPLEQFLMTIREDRAPNPAAKRPGSNGKRGSSGSKKK